MTDKQELKFYCLKEKLNFTSNDYKKKLTKNNKSYVICNCPHCEKNHCRFIKSDDKTDKNNNDKTDKKNITKNKNDKKYDDKTNNKYDDKTNKKNKINDLLKSSENIEKIEVLETDKKKPKIKKTKIKNVKK